MRRSRVPRRRRGALQRSSIVVSNMNGVTENSFTSFPAGHGGMEQAHVGKIMDLSSPGESFSKGGGSSPTSSSPTLRRAGGGDVGSPPDGPTGTVLGAVGEAPAAHDTSP